MFLYLKALWNLWFSTVYKLKNIFMHVRTLQCGPPDLRQRIIEAAELINTSHADKHVATA
jgi:hypothetical protein